MKGNNSTCIIFSLIIIHKKLSNSVIFVVFLGLKADLQFAWSGLPTRMKDEWSWTTTASGVRSVVRGGRWPMQMSCADNWGSTVPRAPRPGLSTARAPAPSGRRTWAAEGTSRTLPRVRMMVGETLQVALMTATQAWSVLLQEKKVSNVTYLSISQLHDMLKSQWEAVWPSRRTHSVCFHYYL